MPKNGGSRPGMFGLWGGGLGAMWASPVWSSIDMHTTDTTIDDATWFFLAIVAWIEARDWRWEYLMWRKRMWPWFIAVRGWRN